MTKPLDSNGVPITLERLWNDLIAARRYDLAAQLSVAIYEHKTTIPPAARELDSQSDK